MNSRISTANRLASLSLMLLSLTAVLAEAQTPHSSEDYFKRGVARYQQKDLNGAIEDFNRALELQIRLSAGAGQVSQVQVIEPGAAPTYYNRAVARYDLHDWDGALADLNQALKLNPRYVLAWIKRGNLRAYNGALDEAIADYDQAIKLDPRAVLAWNNRGLAYQNKGQFDAALSDYARALELDPRLTGALNNRAGIKHERGDLQGALSDYDQAIALDPQLALLYCNRGVTCKSLGDLKGAIADYTEAIRLRPNFNLAYFNRSAAWKALGKGVEAEQDFIRSRAPGETPDSSLEPPIEGVSATKAANPPGANSTPKEKNP